MSYVFLPHLKKFNLTEESYNLICETKVHMLPENIIREFATSMLEADMETTTDKETQELFKVAPKEVNDMFISMMIGKYKELSESGYDIDSIITNTLDNPKGLLELN